MLNFKSAANSTHHFSRNTMSARSASVSPSPREGERDGAGGRLARMRARVLQRPPLRLAAPSSRATFRRSRAARPLPRRAGEDTRERAFLVSTQPKAKSRFWFPPPHRGEQTEG